jgi:hypothetical protein
MGRVTDEQTGKKLLDGLDTAARDTRAEIESTLGVLQSAMHDSLDWRSWVRRHPLPALAVSALLGLRLGRGRWL